LIFLCSLWEAVLQCRIEFLLLLLLETTVSGSRLTITQTQTGTAMHGDQMVETSKPPTRKKSGWSMDPHGRIEGEVWRKHHKFAIDQRPPECNEHESCQALSRAALSIVAQQAQSCHLAFKFFFICSCISSAEFDFRFDILLLVAKGMSTKTRRPETVIEVLCRLLRSSQQKTRIQNSTR
jgi:hypothetical protein